MKYRVPTCHEVFKQLKLAQDEELNSSLIQGMVCVCYDIFRYVGRR